MVRPQLARFLGLLTLAALFAANIGRTVSLGMQDYSPIWVLDAIPAALSDLAFGQRGDYASLKVVSSTYYGYLSNHPHDSRGVAEAVRQVLSLDPSRMSRETILLGGDDKGIVDFVKIAFRLFGYASERIIVVYYLLLFISIALLVLANGETLLPQLIAGTFLAGHYLILPMVFFNLQLQSVLALRFLPVLGMMACLHCLFFVHRPDISSVKLAALAGQAALLLFTVHLRSVAMWEIGVVMIYGAAAWTMSLFRPPSSNNGNRAVVLLPAGLLAAGLLALGGYRRLAYDERYLRGDQIATRPIWHNMLSGLAFDPVLADEYKFKVDDLSELRAVGIYLTERGRIEEWKRMGGTSPGYSRIRWASYDPAARDFLFSIIRSQPGEFIAAFAKHRPLALIRQLSWLYGLRREIPDVAVFVSPELGKAMEIQLTALQKALDERGLRFVLWDRLALFAILAFALVLSLDPRPPAESGWPPFLILAVGSLIPAFIGYPSMHTIAEPALMIASLLYSSAAVALAGLVRLVRGKPLVSGDDTSGGNA